MDYFNSDWVPIYIQKFAIYILRDVNFHEPFFIFSPVYCMFLLLTKFSALPHRMYIDASCSAYYTVNMYFNVFITYIM